MGVCFCESMHVLMSVSVSVRVCMCECEVSSDDTKTLLVCHGEEWDM
jgi:hypothetical protein